MAAGGDGQPEPPTDARAEAVCAALQETATPGGPFCFRGRGAVRLSRLTVRWTPRSPSGRPQAAAAPLDLATEVSDEE